MGLDLWHISGSNLRMSASASAGVALAGMMTQGLRGSVVLAAVPLLAVEAFADDGAGDGVRGYGAETRESLRSAKAPHPNASAVRNSDSGMARPTPAQST